MKYIALIYASEPERTARGEAFQKTLLDGYKAFEGWMATDKAGVKLGGHALQPSTGARSVRVRDGKMLVTDGPFAETKEQLGGYYLLEADSMEEAIKVAARIPTVEYGCIEVRPVFDVPMK